MHVMIGDYHVMASEYHVLTVDYSVMNSDCTVWWLHNYVSNKLYSQLKSMGCLSEVMVGVYSIHPDKLRDIGKLLFIYKRPGGWPYVAGIKIPN